MVEYWRERAHFLLYLGYVWTHLIEPILYLLNFCAQEEAAATLAMADRTLRVTPRGRLLTLHDAWERHQTDANLEHVCRFDRASLRLLHLELGFPSTITLGGSPTQGNGSGYLGQSLGLLRGIRSGYLVHQCGYLGQPTSSRKG